MTHRRGGERGLCVLAQCHHPLPPVSPIAAAILSLKITPREKPGSVAGPLWHGEEIASVSLLEGFTSRSWLAIEEVRPCR